MQTENTNSQTELRVCLRTMYFYILLVRIHSQQCQHSWDRTPSPTFRTLNWNGIVHRVQGHKNLNDQTYCVRRWRGQKPQDLVEMPLTTMKQPETSGRQASMAKQLHPATPPTSHSTCVFEWQFALIPGQQASQKQQQSPPPSLLDLHIPCSRLIA